MSTRRLFVAVLLASLAFAAWPALAPTPNSGFDVEGFGRLPSLEGGRVKQGNFHEYVLLRLSECPQIECHIVASNAAPDVVICR